MTYCLAIRTDAGLVFASDTRTNAGVDYLSSHRKFHVFQPAPDRVFVMLSSGSLATTRELMNRIRRDLDDAPNGRSLLSARYVFEAAEYVGGLSVEIQDRHAPALSRSGVSGEVSLILGGQVQGHPPDVLLVYPQGNYIGASKDTPYLQIGETKYGKPVLDRLVSHKMSLAEAARLALVSLDATIRSNVTVGAPFDFVGYPVDSLATPWQVRIEAEAPYYQALRSTWQAGFEEMFGRLEPFPDPMAPPPVA